MSNNKDTIILGIESSCDETSAAVLLNGEMLSNCIANQTIHEQYGGVVPELASRAHQQNIVPVVHRALEVANINKSAISAIAYTRGPGLMGSLLVGSSFAKSMAMALAVPLLEVNHMHAHILAHFIKSEKQSEAKPEFPFICLTVSGGHTQLVLVDAFDKMTIVGETIDDAAGEAFDKSAKLLGLPYPGGPLVDKYAKLGNSKAFAFSIPEIENLAFSFSGLKTNILYFIKKEVDKDPNFIDKNLNDLCASIQFTIVEILIRKLKKALLAYPVKGIAIAGGVSANSELRNRVQQLGEEVKLPVHIPAFEFCTDNAAMIAMAGHFYYQDGKFSEQKQAPDARLKF